MLFEGILEFSDGDCFLSAFRAGLYFVILVIFRLVNSWPLKAGTLFCFLNMRESTWLMCLTKLTWLSPDSIENEKVRMGLIDLASAQFSPRAGFGFQLSGPTRKRGYSFYSITSLILEFRLRRVVLCPPWGRVAEGDRALTHTCACTHLLRCTAPYPLPTQVCTQASQREGC